MPTTFHRPAARDEVERCRRVRRRLEHKHGGVDRLCDWLATVQERHDRKPARVRKRMPTGGKKRG